MAGKTFRGVGDDEEPSRARPEDDAPRLVDEMEDSRGLYSGPTVVDDQKVAEVLKKLRSLDQGGVAQPLVDSSPTAPVSMDPNDILIDSGPAVSVGPPAGRTATAPGTRSDPGPARLEDIMYPLQRPTAIGRSASTPEGAQPVTIPADAGRGTMFGRSIHLPDANAPDEAEVELSSGAVHYLDGSPPTSQPFPLADGAVVVAPVPVAPLPAKPLGAPRGPAHAPGPGLAAPPQRFHTPYEPTDTQLLRKRSKGVRMVALMVGIGIAGGGWFVSKQFRDAHEETPPPAAAVAPSAPAIDPLPVAPLPVAPLPVAPLPVAAQQPAPQPAAREPAEPAGAPAPAAAAEPAATPPAPTPAATAPVPPKAPEEPARPANRAQNTRRSASAAERRAASRVVAPADSGAPAPTKKPSRSRRRAAFPEDPDATLPPSVESPDP